MIVWIYEWKNTSIYENMNEWMNEEYINLRKYDDDDDEWMNEWKYEWTYE